jgi:tRNA threonylcarbamoyladenosine biosynthesis protein TsaE
VIVHTTSELETERLGERIARAAVPGSIIGLVGPLGAGKTTFVRGLARGLGIDERDVHSPTFITATAYRGRLPLAHVDLYRHDAQLPPGDWLAEILEGEGVAVVEWFERLGDDAPRDVLRIEIAYGDGEGRRRIELRAGGPRSAALLAAASPQGPEAEAAAR